MKRLILKTAFVLVGLSLVFSDSIHADNAKIRRYIHFAKESVFRLKFPDGAYTGSGFMINTLGNMLTCAHVVDSSMNNSGKYVDVLLAENYVTLEIDSNRTFNDVITYNVTVDTVIASLDLAILTVDLKTPQYRGNKNLSLSIDRPVFMGFSNSDSTWEGQEVFTCAYIKDEFSIPKPIIAKGIVSTIRNKCYDPSMDNEVDIIQLDINISKGNSGAPVFLPDDGRVIGIIDWGFFRDSKWQTGYAVAISTNQIVDKLRELKIPFDFK